MKKLFLIALGVTVLLGCNDKNNQKTLVTTKDTVQTSKFQMYEMSEMALTHGTDVCL